MWPGFVQVSLLSWQWLASWNTSSFKIRMALRTIGYMGAIGTVWGKQSGKITESSQRGTCTIPLGPLGALPSKDPFEELT